MTSLRSLLALVRAGPVLILIIIAGIVGLIDPLFFTAGNLTNVATQSSLVAVIGLGQLLVILTRGIDLSTLGKNETTLFENSPTTLSRLCSQAATPKNRNGDTEQEMAIVLQNDSAYLRPSNDNLAGRSGKESQSDPGAR